MRTPCGARSRICCLSYRVTRNVHRCSIGLQVTSASVSAYSICAGADIDSDFWGRSGLPLVLNGGGAPQLSLIIMRLTPGGGDSRNYLLRVTRRLPMRSALAFELACALLGFILGLLADVGRAIRRALALHSVRAAAFSGRQMFRQSPELYRTPSGS